MRCALRPAIFLDAAASTCEVMRMNAATAILRLFSAVIESGRRRSVAHDEQSHDISFTPALHSAAKLGEPRCEALGTEAW